MEIPEATLVIKSKTKRIFSYLEIYDVVRVDNIYYMFIWQTTCGYDLYLYDFTDKDGYVNIPCKIKYNNKIYYLSGDSDDLYYNMRNKNLNNIKFIGFENGKLSNDNLFRITRYFDHLILKHNNKLYLKNKNIWKYLN